MSRLAWTGVDYSKLREVRLETSQIYLSEKMNDSFDQPLESTQYLRAQGEVVSVEAKNGDDRSFRLIERVVLRRRIDLVENFVARPRSQVSLAVTLDGFQLLHDDTVYSETDSKRNFNVKDCVKVEADFENEKPAFVLLCTEKNTHNWVISDLEGLYIGLGA